MSNLDEGTYEILLKPYWSGGTYVVAVSCNTITPSPTFDPDCDAFIDVVGFSGEKSPLNGRYEYDDKDGAKYIHSQYQMTYDDASGWGIYTVSNDDEYITYCAQSDITLCAGRWRVYNNYVEEWVIDPDATSLHSDCDPPDDCDLSDVDPNCMN